jgi:hypothetical protein
VAAWLPTFAKRAGIDHREVRRPKTRLNRLHLPACPLGLALGLGAFIQDFRCRVPRTVAAAVPPVPARVQDRSQPR